MKKYEVIVDYVMTATLVVEARDAASAENKAWRFVHSKKGFDEYVRIAAPANVLFGKRMWMGDGFDIPSEAVELDPEDRLGSRSCIDLTQGGSDECDGLRDMVRELERPRLHSASLRRARQVWQG